jgi:hypothetical protein
MAKETSSSDLADQNPAPSDQDVHSLLPGQEYAFIDVFRRRRAVRGGAEKVVNIGEGIYIKWSQVAPAVRNVVARAGKLVAILFTSYGAAPTAAGGSQVRSTSM